SISSRRLVVPFDFAQSRQVAATTARQSVERAAISDHSYGFILISWFPDSLILVNKFYGDHWWMRLRRDTIRLEKSAFCSDRLSLHRLPPKRGRTVHHLGIGAPRRSRRHKR